MYLVRILLLILLFYLLIRLIGWILFGYRRSSMNFPRNHDNFRNRKEGEVSIDHQPTEKKKIIKKDDGEYIKYEDIKEDRSN